MSLRVARGRGAAASRRLDDAHGIACGAAPNIAPSSCNADPFHFPDRLLARNLVRGSGRLCREAQLRHDAADGGDQPLEILRLERAHAADAEALRLRQLARIDDEAAPRERGGELIEAEAGILRRPEGPEDAGLDALVDK